MSEEQYVLLIGAMLLDIKGKPISGLDSDTSNPAVITTARGGTARNVAENLARLGIEVRLVSTVGEDETGKRLMASTAAAGVNMDYVRVLPRERTGTYMAVLEVNGKLMVAMDDVGVMRHITAEYIAEQEGLFAEAGFVVVDGSLSDGALAQVFTLAHKYGVRVCADPSSARLAYKLQPYLDKLYLAVPNEVEAVALYDEPFEGFDPDASLAVARRMVQSGVRIAVVTLSDFGLVYATTDETGYIPARYSEMVDSTGTGDAVTAALIFGILNEMAVLEAVRLGAAAAGLTLQTHDTVVEELDLDMLYQHLIV
ncbi:MAG TPA: carbohydrate kinase family protein [Anaerolineae bacterium]|nr:carbohydrate kinase family protein [Anaerolineae bacterium]